MKWSRAENNGDHLELLVPLINNLAAAPWRRMSSRSIPRRSRNDLCQSLSPPGQGWCLRRESPGSLSLMGWFHMYYKLYRSAAAHGGKGSSSTDTVDLA